jgi:hypothetical protein
MGGLSAGIIGTIIGFPLDLIKTRMQTAATVAGTHGASSSSSNGIWKTGLTVVRHEGILALYKGLIPPLISLSILNTMTFTMYSYFQSTIQAQRNAWDGRNAMAGAACGVLASPISTVENLVKTQLQLDNVKAITMAATATATATGSSSSSIGAGGGSERQQHRAYKSTWDCVQQLMMTNHRQQGCGSSSSTGISRSNIFLLYKGHGVNTGREMVFLSTYFYLYEGFRRLMVDVHHSRRLDRTLGWWFGRCLGMGCEFSTRLCPGRCPRTRLVVVVTIIIIIIIAHHVGYPSLLETSQNQGHSRIICWCDAKFGSSLFGFRQSF